MPKVKQSKQEGKANHECLTKVKRRIRGRSSKKVNAGAISTQDVEYEDLQSQEHCKVHDLDGECVVSIRRKLLVWYDKNQRQLPWRSIAQTESDADRRGYAVWVSEVMLQQTKVATVISYYNNWMKKWPDVDSLAQASLDDVNRLWAGLGYYSRARRLLEGSQKIVSDFGGHVPSTVDNLVKQVPGIGRYTASAISSIAFGNPVGVVDGNVCRVLSRLLLIGSDSKKPEADRKLWQVANELVDIERPGDFNQALMELGATVCTFRSPKCDACPLRKHCSAFNEHRVPAKQLPVKKCRKKDVRDIENCFLCLQESEYDNSLGVCNYPRKTVKKPIRRERVGVMVLAVDSTMLMVKRPPKGLLAGLLEFPSLILKSDSHGDFATEVMQTYGIPKEICKGKQYVGEVVHIFSHIHTTYVVHRSNADVKVELKNGCWLSRSEIAVSAVSTAMKKVLALVDSTGTDANPKVPGKRKAKSESCKYTKKQTTLLTFIKRR